VSEPPILVVDDEARYVQLITLNLRASGYRVVSASDGLTAVARAEHEDPLLILLDVMLPDLDGYEVCRRIREFSSVPIIMLTAKAEVSHKVAGLSSGADDYVTKPFSVEELIARVQAVLRRPGGARARAPRTFEANGLSIDFEARRVSLAGADVQLSPLEFKLLERLVANADRVLAAQELLQAVWGPGYADADESLRTAIARLRRKIEPDPDRPRYLITVRGVGYSFQRPRSSSLFPNDRGVGDAPRPLT
jgi:DNA-binding response OmpR family regulator